MLRTEGYLHPESIQTLFEHSDQQGSIKTKSGFLQSLWPSGQKLNVTFGFRVNCNWWPPA